MAFNPNQRSLAACIEDIVASKRRLGITGEQIYTSKDHNIWEDQGSSCTNVPGGFNKIILPFNTDGPATFYISSGAPNTRVPQHSHDEGAGIRVILSGSIVYKGVELVQGDWMYMPARARYEFVVGPMGVTMFYCYQCCCGGAEIERP
jgi:hypothetical protein